MKFYKKLRQEPGFWVACALANVSGFITVLVHSEHPYSFLLALAFAFGLLGSVMKLSDTMT